MKPQANTIVVTDTYLGAPNRIIVYDSASTTALVGQWDAPSAAPHSFQKRGYRITQRVTQQGLFSGQQAQDAAKTLGEQASARTLSASIEPTFLLDGPVIISYLGVLWLVRHWTIGTAPGSMLSFDATELFL